MDVAVDFATCVWVVTVEVVIVGIGSAGWIGSTGKFGLVGIGWAITLTSNLLFTGGSLSLFLFSLQHPQFLLVEGTSSTHARSCILI